MDQNHHIGTFIREKMDGFGFRQNLLPKYLKGSIMLGFDGEGLRGGLEGVAKRVKMIKMAVGMKTINQLPKGKRWSLVPLPCLGTS